MLLGGRAKTKAAGPSAALRAWLLDGEHVVDGEGREAYLDDYFMHPGSAWRAWRDVLLPAWIAAHPGSRPAAWWTHELPPGAARLKLGGTGAESCTWYGSEARWGYCDADPQDPPRVESVAAFLKRLGLLQAGEAKRATATAFRPVRLEVDAEGWA